MELAKGKGPLGQRASCDRLRSANSVEWAQGKRRRESAQGCRGDGAGHQEKTSYGAHATGARVPAHARVTRTWTPTLQTRAHTHTCIANLEELSAHLYTWLQEDAGE